MRKNIIISAVLTIAAGTALTFVDIRTEAESLNDEYKYKISSSIISVSPEQKLGTEVSTELANVVLDINNKHYEVDPTGHSGVTNSFIDSVSQPQESPEFVVQQALEEFENSIKADSQALADSGISVTAVEVAITDLRVSKKATGYEILTEYSVVRAFDFLPDWEEIIYTSAEINDSDGSVNRLEIHDQYWYIQHPEDKAEDESIHESLTQSDQAVAKFAALTASSKNEVAAYADKWWDGRNPNYRLLEQDCTNFISQALYAGGWTKVGLAAADSNVNSDSAWWYRPGIFTNNFSRTWADADNWKIFGKASGRITQILVANSREGDIVQYDIGLNGIQHSAIVTYFDHDSNQPLLTYHSTNTHNIPFSVFKARVLFAAKSEPVAFYTWRT